jgi:hypothetical protein
MQTIEVPVGSRLTDSVTLVTAATAGKFKASGIDGCFQYLGTVTAQGVADITGAGLGFMPGTYAAAFNGPAAVAECQSLGLTPGCTVWLDVEGIGPTVTIPSLKQQINDWAAAISGAGFQPGMYVGSNAQLTSLELYQLDVVRYWHSLSRILDRNGMLAEPACGFCVHQLYPTVTRCGVSVDLDFVQQDYQGRLPSWVVA